MILGRLLEGVALQRCTVSPDRLITSVSYDTRTLEPGALFVALSREGLAEHCREFDDFLKLLK